MTPTPHILPDYLGVVYLVIVLPLELQALTTLGLAAVRPATLLLLLLVPAQAGAQGDVDPRRG